MGFKILISCGRLLIMVDQGAVVLREVGVSVTGLGQGRRHRFLTVYAAVYE